MWVWVWWVSFDLAVLFGMLIYTRQFWGAKPLTQFRHRLAEMNHLDHYTDSEQASQLPNSLVPSWEMKTSQF